MKKLRAIIIDDELHARENLKYLLETYCPEMEVVGLADGPQEALQQVGGLDPQVIFLDICMPSGTEGFDFLDTIRDKRFQVVFVTAFKDYAIRALNANAIRHLQKPVDVDDLKGVVRDVLATHELLAADNGELMNYVRSLESLSQTVYCEAPPARITIHHPRGFKIVKQKDLMYLQGEGGHTTVVFTDGTRYLDRKPIAVYESMLDETRFFRIHKAHIINMGFIKDIVHEKGHFVVMNNNSWLPLSRTRLPHFKSLLGRVSGTHVI